MDTTTTYREAIGLWLDDPTVEQMLSETEPGGSDRPDGVGGHPSPSPDHAGGPDQADGTGRDRGAATQTIFDLFLVPILGVEPVETDPDTIPLLTPAQLLAQ